MILSLRHITSAIIKTATLVNVKQRNNNNNNKISFHTRDSAFNKHFLKIKFASFSMATSSIIFHRWPISIISAMRSFGQVVLDQFPFLFAQEWVGWVSGLSGTAPGMGKSDGRNRCWGKVPRYYCFFNRQKLIKLNAKSGPNRKNGRLAWRASRSSLQV